MAQVPKVSQNLLLPVVVIVLVAVSFLVGALWQKVSYLEKGGIVAQGGNSPQASVAPVAAPPAPTTPVKADTLNLAPVTDADHIRGSKNAQLTWIEYSDLQCPFCKKIHPDMQKALSEYGGKLRWVYRHFPLTSIHPRAQKSAEAAECVASSAGNDAFWKFIDGVLESDQKTALEDAGLVKIASASGANGSKVQACITSGEKAQKVTTDQDLGSKAGVSGTPAGFLLDGKGNAWVVNGALPYATIKSVIDTALKN